tara:strand:+ start:9777 stop:9956 length:180 start_codon:yes stop_codon:yes gene_type:complete
MQLFVVLTTTKQHQPFVEIVTDQRSVAELYQKINLDKGMFTVVVEKELNLKPKQNKRNG